MNKKRIQLSLFETVRRRGVLLTQKRLHLSRRAGMGFAYNYAKRIRETSEPRIEQNISLGYFACLEKA
ncbi:MAG: hypothetical protein HYT22_02885, partial [Candidatus Niyogibacteria bacterium]|nr:hypothetical protein [Candidatus Niyogibacteria bacterium]